MLTGTQLTDTETSDFAAAWQLYEQAFPLAERRSLSCHAAAMKHEPGFVCLSLRDSLGFVGILFYWEFTQCIYIEHFAITPSRRGSGLGKRALQLLHLRNLPIMLEIEPVTDAATAGRLRFYEKSGYHRLTAEHYQLPYHYGGLPLLLELLSYPGAASRTLLASFEADYLAYPMSYRDC